MAKLLAPSVRKSIFGGFVPSPILMFFLKRTSKDVIKRIESIVDIKSLIVTGMCTGIFMIIHVFISAIYDPYMYRPHGARVVLPEGRE